MITTSGFQFLRQPDRRPPSRASPTTSMPGSAASSEADALHQHAVVVGQQHSDRAHASLTVARAGVRGAACPCPAPTRSADRRPNSRTRSSIPISPMPEVRGAVAIEAHSVVGTRSAPPGPPLASTASSMRDRRARAVAQLVEALLHDAVDRRCGCASFSPSQIAGQLRPPPGCRCGGANSRVWRLQRRTQPEVVQHRTAEARPRCRGSSSGSARPGPSPRRDAAGTASSPAVRIRSTPPSPIRSAVSFCPTSSCSSREMVFRSSSCACRSRVERWRISCPVRSACSCCSRARRSSTAMRAMLAPAITPRPGSPATWSAGGRPGNCRSLRLTRSLCCRYSDVLIRSISPATARTDLARGPLLLAQEVRAARSRCRGVHAQDRGDRRQVTVHFAVQLLHRGRHLARDA